MHAKHAHHNPDGTRPSRLPARTRRSMRTLMRLMEVRPGRAAPCARSERIRGRVNTRVSEGCLLAHAASYRVGFCLVVRSAQHGELTGHLLTTRLFAMKRQRKERNGASSVLSSGGLPDRVGYHCTRVSSRTYSGSHTRAGISRPRRQLTLGHQTHAYATTDTHSPLLLQEGATGDAARWKAEGSLR